MHHLLNRPATLAISIYLPLARAGLEGKQAVLRLRRLLQTAETRLLQLGVALPAIERWLAPAHQLLLEINTWRQGRAALAIFLSEGYQQIVPLPYPCAEQLTVGNWFQVRPLLPLLTGARHFYLLSLSQNRVALFKGAATLASLAQGRSQVAHSAVTSSEYASSELTEIPLEDVPTNLAEALRYDEFERQLQSHSQGAGAAGHHSPAMFHGQGSSGDSAVTKKYLQRYLRELDRGICRMLDGETLPLITTGVGYLRALYQQSNHYPALLAAGIEGSPERMSSSELAQAAAAILADRQYASIEASSTRLHEWLAQADRRGLADIDNVLKAAQQGRVAELLITVNAPVWGIYDPELAVSERFDQPQPAADDLINLAVIYTLQNGGAVQVVPAQQLPTGALIGALLRY